MLSNGQVLSHCWTVTQALEEVKEKTNNLLNVLFTNLIVTNTKIRTVMVQYMFSRSGRSRRVRKSEVTFVPGVTDMKDSSFQTHLPIIIKEFLLCSSDSS